MQVGNDLGGSRVTWIQAAVLTRTRTIPFFTPSDPLVTISWLTILPGLFTAPPMRTSEAIILRIIPGLIAKVHGQIISLLQFDNKSFNENWIHRWEIIRPDHEFSR